MRLWSRRLWVAVVVVLLASIAGPAVAGPGYAKALRDFEKKRYKNLLYAGQRHLKLGVWCRDKGLVPQATAEFIRAVEVSDGKNPGAVKVLGMMRNLDEKFWKKRRRKTHSGLLAQYEKKAKGAFATTQKERLKLAAWAHGRSDLKDEAIGEYLELLRDQDEAITVDGKERIVLDGGTIPAEATAKIREKTVAINGREYVRDAFLEKIPLVTEIYQAEHERVRVRTMTSNEDAAKLLKLSLALLPRLESDTGGRPTRRMNVFIFKDKKTYDGYLDAAKLGSHKVAAGLAVSSTNVALVDAGGRSEDDVQGITLHELSHLYDFGVTRGVMPSWYREGFAETYGRRGAFTWDGEKLTTGLAKDGSSFARLKGGAAIPLGDFLKAKATKLLQTDRKKGGVFYAQSWAFVRFLRSGADAEATEQFLLWEAMCRGAALGAEAGKPDSENAAPSSQLFDKLLGPRLAEIETSFRAWLEKQ